MRPLLLLLLAAAVSARAQTAKTYDEDPTQPQSVQDWNVPGHENDPVVESFEVSAGFVQQALGVEKRAARKFYDEHCPGHTTRIPRNVQQVCYRAALCGRAGELISPAKQREWCETDGPVMIAKPAATATLLGELLAEAGARRDILNELRGKPRIDEWGADPAESIFNRCVGEIARNYPSPRFCWAALLDQWRAPRQEAARRSWINTRSPLAGPPPDGEDALEGMTGANVLRSAQDRAESVQRDAESGQRTRLASPELFEAFLQGQALAKDCGGISDGAGSATAAWIARQVCGLRDEERRLDNEAKVRSLDRDMPVDRRLAGAQQAEQIRGGLMEVKGIDQPIEPPAQPPQADAARAGDQAAGFRPQVKRRRTAEPPAPGR